MVLKIQPCPQAHQILLDEWVSKDSKGDLAFRSLSKLRLFWPKMREMGAAV